MAEARLTLTAVDQTRAAFDAVKRNLGDVERVASNLTGLLTGLGVGLSAAGLVAFARSAIDAADNLGKLSQRVGVTVESLSGLQYAARLSDVSTEQLGDGLRKLAVNLQAAAGGAKDFQVSFAAVGITAAELRTIRADAALERIADAFAGAEDGAAKTALAVKLFGRSGSDLIPLLNQSSAGLRATADEARRFGLIIGADSAAAAERFNDDLTRLQSSAQAFGITLANSVLPSLNKFTSELLEGQRIFGSFGESLLALGTQVNPFRSLAGSIQRAREELELLERQRANSAGEGNKDLGGFDAKIQRQKKILEFLQFQQRQAIDTSGKSGLDARDLALRQQAAPKGQLQIPQEIGKAAREQSDALSDAERLALQLQQARDKEFEATLDKLARAREQTQGEFLARFEAGNQLDLEAAQAQADAVARILAGTRTGQERGALRDIETLNDALLVGRINADQYEEAYAGVQERLNEIRGVGKDVFESLADNGTQALRDLEFAVQGWGRQFTDTLADALLTGKLRFSDLVNSVVRDLLRLQIQQSITRPLFNALSSFTGNLFGSAPQAAPANNPFQFGGPRAGGGPVAAGTTYLVGERGPELFVPSSSGTIVPNGAGSTTNLVINVDARSDINAVRAAVRESVYMAQAETARAARRG